MDHAARWETSQLLAVRPDLVHLEKFPGMLGPKEVAVLGDDPREAKVEDGEAVTLKALALWSKWIEQSLRDRDQQTLFRLYEKRISDYQGYVREYYSGSWEDAIEKWWEEM